jgi:pyruvate/2-oxoglutarate/acetoin dehydrogenase E1 component
MGLNSIAPVAMQLEGLAKLRCPVVLLENKADYTARPFSAPAGFYVKSDGALLPTLLVHAEHASPDVTIVSYGGIARFVADSLIDIFEQTDAVPEIVVPLCLSPINLKPIVDSVRRTGNLVIVEEATGYGSLGAEIVAQLLEVPDLHFRVRRISGQPTPIPSAPSLEAATLPSISDVCVAIRSLTEKIA